MLQKDVYPYQYMHDWETFSETSVLQKEDFYSHLNMEDISDADSTQAKRVCKDFEIKKFSRISWLSCSKRYITVSRCIWELSKLPWKYILKCMYGSTACFLTVPGLAGQAA